MTEHLFTMTDDPVGEALEILERAKAEYKPIKTFALVSGGNDSTVMLHIVKDYIDGVIHINTGIGIPQTTEHVRWLTNEWNVPLMELRTDPAAYRKMVLGDKSPGFPGPGVHYIAYHILKSDRLSEVQREFVPGRTKDRLLFVSGMRAAESLRRMRGAGGEEISAPRGSMTKVVWANPIVHFDNHMMNEYRTKHDLPRSEVADLLHVSGECLCGSFARPGELDEIELWFPEVAAYIKDLEVEAKKLNKPYCTWGHRIGKQTKAPGPLCSDCVLFEEIPV